MAAHLSSEEFCEAFRAATGTTCDSRQLLHAHGAIFQLNVTTLPIVGALRGAQHRLGILSNTCESHWQYCWEGKFVFLRTCFETYVLSYEAGAMKPSAQIYATAAERAGVPPAEIFFVDDKVEFIDEVSEDELPGR